MKRGWVTSRIAGCNDCKWECQDNDRKILSMAYNHAKNHKHDAWAEVVKCFHYDFKEKEATK